jgi:hypothetical protein
MNGPGHCLGHHTKSVFWARNISWEICPFFSHVKHFEHREFQRPENEAKTKHLTNWTGQLTHFSISFLETTVAAT